MLTTITTPVSRSLGGGLTLKTIHDHNDLAHVAAFNDGIFGHGVGELTRALMLHHPHTRPQHLPYIEDTNNGQIVASLFLIPWTWRYEDVTLSCAEMGIVGTAEDHRNRGLMRLLDGYFKELLHAEAFDLSAIQGIPYFYRQFGYEYAMPLEAGWHLELRRIPALPPDTPYRFRRATLGDIPTLMTMYDAATGRLDISAARSTEVWRYLLAHNAGTATQLEVWLMLDGDHTVGYCSIPQQGFGDGLIVSEVSRLGIDAAGALLGWLGALAAERGKPAVRLNLPVSHDLLRLAQGLGAYDTGTYAWQMLLPDVARLLNSVAPVLERRIADSAFAGMTRTVILNLYREAYALHFADGRLRAARVARDTAGDSISLPPSLLAPLLLGYRSRAELASMYPDVSAYGEMQMLADVLFPKLDSFIYTQY